MATTIRMDDAEFIAALSRRVAGECAEMALDLRTMLAKCSKLPRRCVRPDSFLGEIIFASGRNPHGVDVVDILCHMERFAWYKELETSLDQVRAFHDEDTVEAFVGQVIEVYQRAREMSGA